MSEHPVRRRAAAAVVAVAVVLGVSMSPAVGKPTIRASVGPFNQGNATSGGPDLGQSVSFGGTEIAFVSTATNLDGSPCLFPSPSPSPPDPCPSPSPSPDAGGSAATLTPASQGPIRNIFVYNLLTGLNARVSVDPLGGPANGDSRQPALSGDGRYVAFESDATNLTLPGLRHAPSGAGLPHGSLPAQVYVRDLLLRRTILVSVGPDGSPGDGPSTRPAVSADGRTIAFTSQATNFGLNVEPGVAHIYLRDLETGETLLVSAGPDGIPGDGDSRAPSLSADGRRIAFHSEARNLVPGDTNGVADVFVRDMASGSTQRASVASGTGTEADGPSTSASLTADGMRVVFTSDATNLIPGQPSENGVSDVYLHDLEAGSTLRISTAGGQEPNGASRSARISPDGSAIAFASEATNLPAIRDRTDPPEVPLDHLPQPAGDEVPKLAGEGEESVARIYLLTGGALRDVSAGLSGQPANAPSYQPALSAEGLVVAFSSDASNLVPGDTNGVTDVFAHLDETTCGGGAGEDGPISSLVHDEVEARAGPLERAVHRANCDILAAHGL